MYLANKMDRQRMMEQFMSQVRWRFSQDNTKVQSNARLVEWSDGSFGMYIGKEYYDIEVGEDNVVDKTAIYTSLDNTMVNQGSIDYTGSLNKKKTGSMWTY